MEFSSNSRRSASWRTRTDPPRSPITRWNLPHLQGGIVWALGGHQATHGSALTALLPLSPHLPLEDHIFVHDAFHLSRSITVTTSTRYRLFFRLQCLSSSLGFLSSLPNHPCSRSHHRLYIYYRCGANIVSSHSSGSVSHTQSVVV